MVGVMDCVVVGQEGGMTCVVVKDGSWYVQWGGGGVGGSSAMTCVVVHVINPQQR